METTLTDLLTLAEALARVKHAGQQRKGSDDALYVKLADLADNLHDDWVAEKGSLRARYIKSDLQIRAALHRRGAVVPAAH